jgi:CRP-like cAMP-binding protein
VGKREKEGVLIDFPLTRQDLAEMTGTTLHTVSRMMSAWQKRGIVRLGRRKVLIQAPHELVILADDLQKAE